MREIRLGHYVLPAQKPLVMGIVNLTPDSFSGDGRAAQEAIKHAGRQRDEGADVLDLGAESSRPGAAPVSLEEEIARLKPVLAETVRWGIPISVDTYKPQVMSLAAEMGASLINDIAALRQPGALEAVASTQCSVCLMHMQGEPRSMQLAPEYEDVFDEVAAFLRERVAACEQAGIEKHRMLIDPGFGFGKNLAHNTDLFRQQNKLCSMELPLLVGVSRKRMLGEITGRTQPLDRIVASTVAAVLAAQQGAQIVRVHDVAATCDALAVWQALAA